MVAVGFATACSAWWCCCRWLGHASWHAYRDLVDADELPSRPDEPGAR